MGVSERVHPETLSREQKLEENTPLSARFYLLLCIA